MDRLPVFDFGGLSDGDLLTPFGRPLGFGVLWVAGLNDGDLLRLLGRPLGLFSAFFSLPGLLLPWDVDRLPVFDFGELDDGHVFALMAGEGSALVSSFELLGVDIFLATLVYLPSVRRLADLDCTGLCDGRPFVTDEVLLGEGWAFLPCLGLPGVAFS